MCARRQAQQHTPPYTLMHAVKLSRAVCTWRCVLHPQDEVVVAKAVELLDGLVGIIPASSRQADHEMCQHDCMPLLRSIPVATQEMHTQM